MKWFSHREITNHATKAIFPEIVRRELSLLAGDEFELCGIDHYNPRTIKSIIFSILRGARLHFLMGREYSALRELARAIHFIQDLCVSYSWGLYHKPMTINMLQKLRGMADEAIAKVDIWEVGFDEKHADERIRGYEERYEAGRYGWHPITIRGRPYIFFKNVFDDELERLRREKQEDPVEVVRTACFLTYIAAKIVWTKPDEELISLYEKKMGNVRIWRAMLSLLLLSIIIPLMIIFKDYIDTQYLLALVSIIIFVFIGWVGALVSIVSGIVYAGFILNYIIIGGILKILHIIPEDFPTIPATPFYFLLFIAIYISPLISRAYGSYIFSEAEWLMPYVEYGREDIVEFLEKRMYYYY